MFSLAAMILLLLSSAGLAHGKAEGASAESVATCNCAEDAYPTRLSAEALTDRVDPVAWQPYDLATCQQPPPISQQQYDEYVQRGYLLLPAVFSEEELLIINEHVASIERNASALASETVIGEAGNDGVIRSLFDVFRQDTLLRRLGSDRRILDVVQYLLNDQVYVYQSRLNYKPAFEGLPFSWHSDFETWHAEDGMPRMRALSASVLLTENRAENGPLIVMPGSQTTFIGCPGQTPDDHYQTSLKKQDYGVPTPQTLQRMFEKHGMTSIHAPAGSVLLFDNNLLHASNSNVSPLPRHNVFYCYNARSNVACAKPFAGVAKPRPDFIANRDRQPEPVEPTGGSLIDHV